MRLARHGRAGATTPGPAENGTPLALLDSMKDLVSFAKIDPRLGYKMTEQDSRGHTQEIGAFRFMAGAWMFRASGAEWVPVGAPWFLPAQLKAWDSADGCGVTLWRCAVCSKTPEGREFDKALFDAGGQISHGYCESCAASLMAMIPPPKKKALALAA